MTTNVDIKRAKSQLVERLKPEQRKHLTSVGWFLHGPRRSGRTTVSVTSAILSCLDNPDIWIYIIDHEYLTPTYNKAKLIQALLEAIASLPTEVKDHIQYDEIRPAIKYRS